MRIQANPTTPTYQPTAKSVPDAVEKGWDDFYAGRSEQPPRPQLPAEIATKLRAYDSGQGEFPKEIVCFSAGRPVTESESASRQRALVKHEAQLALAAPHERLMGFLELARNTAVGGSVFGVIGAAIGGTFNAGIVGASVGAVAGMALGVVGTYN